MSVIETASRVLRDEAAAVESLVNKLDGQFEKAVRMIDEMHSFQQASITKYF